MKFLVPTDFSENSAKTIEYAASLAQKVNARVQLMHAWTSVPTTTELEAISIGLGIEYLAENSEEALKSAIKDFTPRYEVFEKPISVQGFPALAIENISKKEKPDLVIMGSRGLGAMGSAVLGSISKQVFSQGVRPLLVVPKEAIPGQFDTIVFATDFHDSDAEHLAFLANLIEPFGGMIHVVHFHDSEESDFVDDSYFERYKEDMKKKIRYARVSFHFEQCDDLNDAMHEYVTEHNVSLVAMANVSRSFWQSIVDPSFTRKWLRDMPTPLMVFGAKDKAWEDF
ncbi:MAG: universal stress protein [Flavobacteriales bacterium]